ncbi:hypothetical protein QJS04_geneDACA018544 [Acorus gramineus]|uniref:Uncharacterized protein n=1 Tax=Acorus gramineus TaxID=55184 RepID=A0AAV9BY21_ACOGR|nr:hypothetical protein QJS04_geneDACA018544 [Acorus gramineus]
MEVGEAESGLGLKASLRSRPLKSIQLSDAHGRTRSGHYTSLEGDTLTSVLLQNQTDQEAFVEAHLQEPETLQTPVPSQVQGHDDVVVSSSTESGSMTTAAHPNQVPAPNSSHASWSHSQTDGIVKTGWKVSYWITALSFAAFISILCMSDCFASDGCSFQHSHSKPHHIGQDFGVLRHWICGAGIWNRVICSIWEDVHRVGFHYTHCGLGDWVGFDVLPQE